MFCLELRLTLTTANVDLCKSCLLMVMLRIIHTLQMKILSIMRTYLCKCKVNSDT